MRKCRRSVRQRGKNHHSRASCSQPSGARARHRLGDDDVGLERQVRAVRLDSAHRQNRGGSRTGRVSGVFPGHCGKRLQGYRILTAVALFGTLKIGAGGMMVNPSTASRQP